MCHRCNDNSSIKRDSRGNLFFGWTRNPSLWRNKIRRKNCWNGPFTSNYSDLNPTFHITSLIGPISNESQGFDRNDACARQVTLIWGKMIFFSPIPNPALPLKVLNIVLARFLVFHSYSTYRYQWDIGYRFGLLLFSHIKEFSTIYTPSVPK